MAAELGDKVKDSITGFSGICVAKTHWLNGCARITIQPEKLEKDGKMPDTQTFDENQVLIIKSKQHPIGSRLRGGPRPEPRQVPNVRGAP